MGFREFSYSHQSKDSNEPDFCLPHISHIRIYSGYIHLLLGDPLMLDSLALAIALASPAAHIAAFDAPTIRQAQIKAPPQGESIETREAISANAPEDSGAKIAYLDEQ